MLASVVARLVQGEDINTVVTQAAAQVLLYKEVSEQFDEWFKQAGEAPAFETPEAKALRYEGYLKGALINFVVTSIVNGGEDMAQAAQNISVQTLLTAGLVESQVSYLTVPVFKDGQLVGFTPSAAGAGVVAASLVLVSSVLNGNGITQQTVGQAAIAVGTGDGNDKIYGQAGNNLEVPFWVGRGVGKCGQGVAV